VGKKKILSLSRDIVASRDQEVSLAFQFIPFLVGKKKILSLSRDQEVSLASQARLDRFAGTLAPLEE